MCTLPQPNYNHQLTRVFFLSNNFYEQQPHLQKNNEVTAIMAVLKFYPDHIRTGSHTTSNKKVQRKKIIMVLIDSESDGDLLFHQKKEHPNTFPTQLGRSQSHGVF